MKPKSVVSSLMASLAAGALLAALPLTVQSSPGGLALAPSFAHAKDGSDDHGDDSGSDDHGGSGGSDDSGSDDSGGSSGSGSGSDDSGSDDHGGSGDSGSDDHGGSSSSDDSGSDDHGGSGGSGSDDSSSDDHGGGSSSDDSGKVEITRTGIEVVHADGSKEEVRNGRYERKDASGRTVEERRATARDFTRMSKPPSPPASGQPAPGRTIRVGHVTKVEAQGGNLEVLYSTGWKEELQDGRYELKDPNNNTVVERPARQGDIARLQQIAR